MCSLHPLDAEHKGFGHSPTSILNLIFRNRIQKLQVGTSLHCLPICEIVIKYIISRIVLVCSSLGEFKGDRFNMRSFIEKIISIASIDRKNFWLNQLWCFFCLIVYTVSSVVFPSFLSKIVDVGIATHNNVALVKYSLEMLLCGIIMIAFNYLQKVYFFKFGNRITLREQRCKQYKKKLQKYVWE